MDIFGCIQLFKMHDKLPDFTWSIQFNHILKQLHFCICRMKIYYSMETVLFNWRMSCSCAWNEVLQMSSINAGVSGVTENTNFHAHIFKHLFVITLLSTITLFAEVWGMLPPILDAVLKIMETASDSLCRTMWWHFVIEIFLNNKM